MELLRDLGWPTPVKIFFFRTDKKEMSTSSYSLSKFNFFCFWQFQKAGGFSKDLTSFFGNSGVLMNIK
jgi:hypothetical protein